MALPAGADPVLWLKGTLVLGAAVPLSLRVLVRQEWVPLTPTFRSLCNWLSPKVTVFLMYSDCSAVWEDPRQELG